MINWRLMGRMALALLVIWLCFVALMLVVGSLGAPKWVLQLLVVGYPAVWLIVGGGMMLRGRRE